MDTRPRSRRDIGFYVEIMSWPLQYTTDPCPLGLPEDIDRCSLGSMRPWQERGLDDHEKLAERLDEAKPGLDPPSSGPKRPHKHKDPTKHGGF